MPSITILRCNLNRFASARSFKPNTLVGWHRKGYWLFWKWKSHPRGRPRVPADARKLIVETAMNNPPWGEERTVDELLLKIGVQISPRTIRRYIPKHPRRPADPAQRWMTFVRKHIKAIIATDFVVTATFQLVYVVVIMQLDRGESVTLTLLDTGLPNERFSSFDNA